MKKTNLAKFKRRIRRIEKKGKSDGVCSVNIHFDFENKNELNQVYLGLTQLGYGRYCNEFKTFMDEVEYYCDLSKEGQGDDCYAIGAYYDINSDSRCFMALNYKGYENSM